MSCQKEDFLNGTAVKEPLAFTASITQNDTKATIDISGSYAKLLWESTDKITVTDGSGHVAVYKVSSGAGTKTASFVKDSGDDLDSPGTYAATFGEAPSTTLSQPYSGTSVPVYMTAPTTSDKDNLCFTVQGGVLKLTLTKAEEQARKIVISNETVKYTLACTSPVDLSSGATFYMNLPAGTYTKMAVYDGNCRVAERTGLSMTIKENTLLPANTSTLTFNTIPDALPGTFTIDRNGNWIHFSKGNLQATYSAETSSYSWDFAANQYDYVGKAAGNTTITSQTDGAKVDLFGWSTTASKNNWGIHTDSSLMDVSADYEGGDFKDWGATMGGNWRTLTMSELVWLIGPEKTGANPGTNCRTGSAVDGTKNARYLLCKIKISESPEVYSNGMLIFPDVFTWPTGESAPSSSGVGWFVNYWNNEYVPVFTAAQFAMLEEAGAVFLPAAGARGGSKCSNVNEAGYYWSSTVYDGSRSHLLFFHDGKVNGNNKDYRCVAYSVRLVTDVN